MFDATDGAGVAASASPTTEMDVSYSTGGEVERYRSIPIPGWARALSAAAFLSFAISAPAAPSVATVTEVQTTADVFGNPAADRRSDLSAEVLRHRGLVAAGIGFNGTGLPPQIREALSFIDLIPSGAKKPQTSASGDGEVGFYWKTDRDFIDVSFYGDNQIYYYARVEGSGIEVADMQEFSRDALPKKLVRAILEI